VQLSVYELHLQPVLRNARASQVTYMIGLIASSSWYARAGSRPAARVACLGLRHGDAAYLFDATPDLPAQLHALRGRGGGAAAAPDGIFLTHAHVGHYLGLAYLGRECLRASGVPVYASSRMRAFLIADAPWRLLVSEGRIELRDNGAPVDLGAGMRVSAYAVPQRAEVSDTVGYLLEGPRRCALFIPDTDAWSAWGRDIRLVESVDFAFLDATFYSGAELPGRPPGEVPHPLVTDTLERLAGLGNRVQLIHLNHTNPLWEDPSPAVAHGFHVAQEGAAFEM
jgi:pyrroloquinoline quinone biosynthesis protein B